MAGLSSVLESGPHLDDELTELESRFTEMHMRYGDLCAKYRPHGDTMIARDASRLLYAPMHLDFLKRSRELRQERAALVQSFTQLPQVPTSLELVAERLRIEVQDAAVSHHGLQQMRAQLHNYYLKRSDSLRTQRSMITSRLQRYVRNWETLESVSKPLHKRLRLIQKDLEATESRILRLEPVSQAKTRPVAKASTGEDLFFKSTPYEESTLSSIYRGDIIVCLRESCFEDRSTRMLRRFLQRMQHLPISHRRETWRRAIELQNAAAKLLRTGQLQDAVMPRLGLRRDRVDQALRELSSKVGIHESLSADEGHTFTYAVTMEFGRIFERQMLRMLFLPYPDQAPVSSSDEQASATPAAPAADFVRQESASSGRDTTQSHGLPHPTETGGGPYLKPSDWVAFVLLQPEIDPIIVEQSSLLTPQSNIKNKPQDPSAAGAGWRGGADGVRRETMAAGSSVGKSARGKMSIAAQRNTLQGRMSMATRRRMTGMAERTCLTDEHITDVKLHKELEFLKETNAKAAHQKLSDLAARRASLEFSVQKNSAQANGPSENGVGVATAANGARNDVNSETETPGATGGADGSDTNIEMATEHKVRSYYLLRYIRSRELRYSLLHLLNLFRFVQQRVAHGELSAQLLVDSRSPHNAAAAVTKNSSAAAVNVDDDADAARAQRAAASVAMVGRGADSPPSLPSSAGVQFTSLPCDARDALAAISGAERLAIVNNEVVVFDGQGVPVVHEAATKDLLRIEDEIIEIGSHYIRKAEEDMLEHGEDENEEGIRVDWVDRAGVLLDLLIAEVGLHKAKWQLLQPYLEIYEHVLDPADRHAVAQRIVNVMADRPRLDFDAPYFAECYAGAIAATEERARLLRTVLDHQILTERHMAKEITGRMERVQQQQQQQAMPPNTKKDDESCGELENPQLHVPSGLSHPGEGFPTQGLVGLATQFVPEGARNVDLLDFFTSASLVWHIDRLVEDTQMHFVNLVTPEVRYHAAVGRACAMMVAEEWQKELRKQPVHHLTTSRASGDVFGGETMDDPAWLTCLMEDTMKSLPSVFSTIEERKIHKEEEDMDLRSAFAELRSHPPDERVLIMYANLLEHVTVRRLLADTVLEIRVLESMLMEQGRLVGTDVVFRCDPIPEFGEYPTKKALQQVKSNLSFEDGSQRLSESCVLLAGDMDAEFGDLDLSNGDSVVLYCCDSRLHELRVLYQHELANRWLYAMCALHNAILLDEPMERIIAADVSSDSLHKPPTHISINFDALKALMRTSVLSATLCNEGSEDIEPASDVQSLPIKSELAKLSFSLQFPASSKSMVRLGVSVAFRDSTRELKQALQTVKGYGTRERLLRRFKGRMLSYGSVFIAEAACDLAVRVQASNCAIDFQRLVALVPKDFSPFKNSTAKDPRVFVAEDGTIRSIFNIPMPSELLQLRGTGRAPPDVGRRIVEAEQQLPSVFDENIEKASALPLLDIKYEGPSYVALCFMQQIVPLVSLMFFWSSLSGDRRVLLRLHHAVAFAQRTPDEMAKAAKTVLHADMLEDVQMEDLERESLPQDPVHRTWDALENIRVDFINWKAQMQSLKHASTETIFGFLCGKVQCAAWRTSLLFRRSMYEALGRDGSREAGELSRWARYLENEPIDGGSHLVVCHALGEVGNSRDESVEEAGATACLVRQLIVRPSNECKTMGMMHINVPGRTPEASFHSKWPEQLSRPCPYLHLFVHALLNTHAAPSDVHKRSHPSSDSTKMEIPKPRAFEGRTIWHFPRLPLEASTRSLALLPVAARHAAAEVYVQLEMKLEAYFLLREVSAEDSESLEAEAELVSTMLTVSRLRETVLCAHLRAPPPASKKEVEALDAYFTANLSIMRSTSDAAEGDDPDSMLSHPSAHALDDHFETGGADDLSGTVDKSGNSVAQELTRVSMKHEMRNMYDLITRLLGELHKVVLKFSLAALSRQQDSLKEITARDGPAPHGYMSGHGHEHHGAGHAPIPQASTSSNSSSTSSADLAKAKAVAAFNRIRLRGTRVRTYDNVRGSEAYVIRENDLDECIEELGRRILQWARVAVEGQLIRAESRLTDAVSSVQNLEETVLQKASGLKNRESAFEAQVQSSVADRGYSQLFEVDRLHRVLNELAAAAFEMEYRLNAEVRQSVLEEIGVLEKQLVEAQHRKGQYFAELRMTVQSEVMQLRQGVLQQLQKMSVSNYALQQKVKVFQEEWRSVDYMPAEASPRSSMLPVGDGRAASNGPADTVSPRRHPVCSEGGRQEASGDIEEMHQEINELHKAQTRVQTFFNLKFQNLRQEFEKQIQAFTTTLSSNSDLWERASEVKERQIIAEDELARSQRRAAATHDTIERITLQATKESETAARLEAWKANAFEWLDTLQREEKKYQQDGDIDAHKIEVHIERLDEEIKQLSRGDQTEQRIVTEVMNHKRERKKLRRELREEERLIKKAEAKANLIRREIECGDIVDDESLVGLLCEEYRIAAQKLSDLDADNSMMRSTARGIAGRRGHHLTDAGPNIDKDRFVEKAREMVAHSTVFEEKMCFSIGLTRTPRPPWHRSQIDSVHGGGGGGGGGGSLPSSSSKSAPGSARSGYPRPRDLGRQQVDHWSKDSPEMRSQIVQNIRNEISGMAGDSAKAKAKAKATALSQSGALTSRVFPGMNASTKRPNLPGLATRKSMQEKAATVSSQPSASGGRPGVRHTVAGSSIERDRDAIVTSAGDSARQPRRPRHHGSMGAAPHSFRA